MKGEILKMEEFKDEVKDHKQRKGNQIEMDTERSSTEIDNEKNKYQGEHKPVCNETVESITEEAG